MPSIASYVTWASSQRAGNQEAALHNDGVTELGRVTSWWSRLCGARSVRQSVVDGFKAALTETYGETIADQAFRSACGERAGRLTASMILNANTAAANLVEIKERLLPRNAQSAEVEQVELALPFVVKVSSLLSMTPATQNEAISLCDRIEETLSEIENDPQGQMTVQLLRAKKLEVLRYKGHLPSGIEAKRELAGVWEQTLTSACRHAADVLKNVATRKPEKWGGLMNVVENLNRLADEMTDDGVMLRLMGSKKKKLGDELQARFNACFKKAGYGYAASCKVGDTKFSKFIKAFHDKTLDEGAWNPIRKEFVGILAKQSFRLESDITAGRHIDPSLGEEYDRQGYKHVNAFNCHHKNTSCAVNLATTELKIDGQTVFHGVRHGIHDAREMPNNNDANVVRARQTVCAALVEHLKRFPRTDGNAPIHLNMTSISLVTSSFGLLSEASMQKAQEAAWRRISDHNISVTVNGTTYNVIPHISSVNFGVNSIAAGNIAGVRVFKRLFGGARRNQTAMTEILQRAENFQSEDPKTLAAVQTLARQIREIYESRSHLSDGGEAYKLPSRLAVLTYLMGDMPVWNCKSGKDRTGMLDVEAKFLATLIERNISIPKPGDELTDEQKELFNTLVLQSGNHEMQKYNTGAAGYKLTDSGMKGVASIGERAGFRGDAEKRRTFQGLSGYVGS